MSLSIPINKDTLADLDKFISKPSQSVLLLGQKWNNKQLLVNYLITSILNIPETSLINYPYILEIKPEDNKAIGIEKIRQINNFIGLKVPVKKEINRFISITSADKMTIEAQNALLKSLEEPPKGTVFILTTQTRNKLLPTILSRLSEITIKKPTKDQLINYYSLKGIDESEVTQAYSIADGLPKLMEIILEDDDHSLNKATKNARLFLSQSTFNRLNSVNDLSKDKHLFLDMLFVIKQMSKIGLSSKDAKTSSKWQKIYAASLKAENDLNTNGLTKLTITDMILSIA